MPSVLIWLSAIGPRNLTGTDFPSVGGGATWTPPWPTERPRWAHRSRASTLVACGATLAAPTGARHAPRDTPAAGGGDAAPPPPVALAAGACGRHATHRRQPDTHQMRVAVPPLPRALSATAHVAAPPQGAVPPRPASTEGATGGATDARVAKRARGVTRPRCAVRQRADGRGSADGGAAAAGIYEWRTGCPLFPPSCPPTFFASRGV